MPSTKSITQELLEKTMSGHLEENAGADCPNKRVVVVGSDGRLGRSLVEVLRQRYSVVGLGRKELDLASSESITWTLEPLDYDFLFLTGALTGVDYCETHEAEAFAVNAEAPGRIAEISASKGAHVTYISTDMVFDGSKVEPYLESDQTDPISVYGASKLEGERRVLAASPDNLVARVSWVFGPGRPAFPEWIINQACAKEEITLPGNKIGCPTYTLDLIEWLEALVLGLNDGPAAGVHHLCNSEPCTWRDWGQFCIDSAREAGMPIIAEEIQGIPVDSVAAFVARRPVNSALDTGKFIRLTGMRPRSWRDAIREHVMQNILRPE
jgi:dTDP-4-dehydrorhamnose reductase